VFTFWDAEYGTCPYRALEDKAFRADTGQRQGDIRKLAWSAYDGTSISLRQGKASRLGKVAPVTRVPCTKALKVTLDMRPAPRRCHSNNQDWSRLSEAVFC
jgi:integrase